MAQSKLQGRNVRPARAHDEDIEYDEASGSENDEVASATGSSMDEDTAGRREAEASGHESDSNGDDDVRTQISSVSFGALAKAQDSLARKRKRGSDTTAEQEDKLQSVRARLQELREKKAKTSSNRKTTKPSVTATSHLDSDAASDSDSSAPSEEGAPSKSRTSKHAPASQTSKRQVSRKRTVIDVPKRHLRDPRFDAHNPTTTDPHKTANAYSFLRDYQKSEISQLKSAIKQPGMTEDDKEVLKRKIGAMENRIRAKEAQEREQEVVRRHRREERERVGEGKKPYFLKQKEIKERALVEKFKGMKGKEREKAVEKKRKKEGQKEKKRMPEARRGAG